MNAPILPALRDGESYFHASFLLPDDEIVEGVIAATDEGHAGSLLLPEVARSRGVSYSALFELSTGIGSARLLTEVEAQELAPKVRFHVSMWKTRTPAPSSQNAAIGHAYANLLRSR